MLVGVILADDQLITLGHVNLTKGVTITDLSTSAHLSAMWKGCDENECVTKDTPG